MYVCAVDKKTLHNILARGISAIYSSSFVLFAPPTIRASAVLRMRQKQSHTHTPNCNAKYLFIRSADPKPIFRVREGKTAAKKHLVVFDTIRANEFSQSAVWTAFGTCRVVLCCIFFIYQPLSNTSLSQMCISAVRSRYCLLHGPIAIFSFFDVVVVRSIFRFVAIWR